MRCTMTGEPYTVFGYGGKQVRDNIHSADLVAAFAAFHAAPRPAAVYNIGGGRESNCSMLEAIDAVRADRRARARLDARRDENRIGDHRWWICDLEPFRRDYPDWELTLRHRGDPARDPRAATPSCGWRAREAVGRHPGPQRGRVDRRDGRALTSRSSTQARHRLRDPRRRRRQQRRHRRRRPR